MDIPLDAFIVEARELLTTMESGLLKIEDGSHDDELLNEVFRAAHTIKGSAGLFGLDYIVDFTHGVENIMDRAREAEIVLARELVGILLACVDYISSLIDSYEREQPITSQLVNLGCELNRQLAPWIVTNVTNKALSSDAATSLQGEEYWYIKWTQQADALRNGMDPIAIIKYLAGLGEVLYCSINDHDIPSEDEFDPESLYLSFELALASGAAKTDIEDAFLFIKDDAVIKITPPRSSSREYIELIQKSTGKRSRLGEILLSVGAVSESELASALDYQKQVTLPKLPLGEILVERESVSKDIVDVALLQQKIVKSVPVKLIRVDSERLDQLINLVGELVINQQRVNVIADRVHDGPLEESVASMMALTEQVRDAALNLRMVAIGETFQRFKRVVRDTATALNKDIKLVLIGEDTELDRSMVEKLTDPLTHIVRNAIDHGIESIGVRAERSKPTQGTIKLAASHDSGSVVIEIEDDGGGLDAVSIKAKAVEKGLLGETDVVTEQDLYPLIFHPGFSTATEVTNLSGRGVGMDVVKRNIEELQGVIQIVSRQGVGTRITIRLPLTMAIIDGFHVSCAGTDFIIPQNTLVECLDFDKVKHVDGSHSVNLRGDLVPYVELQSLLSLGQIVYDHKKLIVVQFGSDRAGIVVDKLFGEMQTVVKPLSPIFQALRGVGGCSLLGSGEIAFILDVPQLIAFAVNREHKMLGSYEEQYEP